MAGAALRGPDGHPVCCGTMPWAITASLALRVLFNEHPSLGGTSPAGSAMQSFILELLLTLMLMMVMLSVSTGASEKGNTAGIAVGAVIGLEALFGGPCLGSLDESGSIPRSSRRRVPPGRPLALYVGAGRRGRARGAGL